jgi:hypothetical protein
VLRAGLPSLTRAQPRAVLIFRQLPTAQILR